MRERGARSIGVSESRGASVSPRARSGRLEEKHGTQRGRGVFRGGSGVTPRTPPAPHRPPARPPRIRGTWKRARETILTVSDPHSRPSPPQAVSKRVLGASNDRYAKNIHKRGLVDIRAKDKSKSFSVGPVMLGFFIFVVIGSSLLQIIRTATSGAGPEAGRL